MTETWRLSAAELADRIRARQLSAREAAQSALDRLAAVNPAINAVVDCRPEEVLAQADAVDAALARGEDPGILAGVPVTVKVNIDQAGHATTNGVTLQRDLIAASNSPVVDNLRKAGAVILGRTNTPAFSYRWFTSNQLHGTTRNPRDPLLTPGGSSGGAAAAVASGIGHLAHGTDIAGSIRYPAYACGVHGLRPSLGRVPAYNASLPERAIGPQLTAVSGPIGRTIRDLRLGLAAMSAFDARDPWWVPAPLEGPALPRVAALCVRPDGLQVAPEVEAALQDAARRLRERGWRVDEVEQLPPLKEAADLQITLWMGDGYAAMEAAAIRENDPGALAALAGHKARAAALDLAGFSQTLTRRATLLRLWQQFLLDYPLVLLPVSAELPFPDQLDLQSDAAYNRVWAAQMTQIGLPLLGLPALSVCTGMHGTGPLGVQLVAARYREDICLAAGEAIEQGGVALTPVDPA
ncbi:amidase family protein [Noviherbaspirillum sp. L7-7A]|uniref:amidase family protein n=1 Tax=Noviherbaspirillum sp. L7-7A TaxID=2850560 RepID=UPI001C2C4241|nr:amidase family protein [Noviherbaspirillum sp. L7-7A]MBV0881642.1 amidase family protein [Noviherbaspirillum sp. L7-7A]